MAPRIKLSAELSDGDHWSIIDTPGDALAIIREWFAEHGDTPGESFSVEIVSMSDAEVDALPDL